MFHSALHCRYLILAALHLYLFLFLTSPFQFLFSNNVLAPLVPHPNFMYPAGLNIQSTAHAESLPTRLLVLRIRDRKITAADQMGRQAVVGVRSVVCVSIPAPPPPFLSALGSFQRKCIGEKKGDQSIGGEGVRAIGPCEDVREAPGSHLSFGFFAGGRRHCGERVCDVY